MSPRFNPTIGVSQLSHEQLRAEHNWLPMVADVTATCGSDIANSGAFLPEVVEYHDKLSFLLTRYIMVRVRMLHLGLETHDQSHCWDNIDKKFLKSMPVDTDGRLIEDMSLDKQLGLNIPDGWEFVAVREAEPHEFRLGADNEPIQHGTLAKKLGPRVIVRRQNEEEATKRV